MGGGERSCVWDVFVGHESMLFHTKSRLHNVARLVFLPKFSVLYGTRGERARAAPVASKRGVCYYFGKESE